ncbi:hypothetical protein ACLBX9_03035 [Methylobacterium sp. A49B]
MRNPPEDNTAAARSAARRFLAELRDAADVVGSAGWVSIPELVSRAAADATREAEKWSTRSGRQRFLIELAAEARSEWMVQPEPDGDRAKFYAALRDRISELAAAER